MSAWFLALIMTCAAFRCGAQDNSHYTPPPMTTNCFDYSKDTIPWTPIWMIDNLEYVTIKNITGKHKLYHVKYLVHKNGCYYFPNLTPVQIVNYKVRGYQEVIVKK
jgi:hypothetical protein